MSVHTGVGAWVKVDTTSVWTANGGNVPTGTHLLIDGVDASTLVSGFVQPTPAAPVVCLLMTVATHTISLGSHSDTLDVYWRAFPWKTVQPASGLPTTWYPTWGPPQASGAIVPSAANSYADGTPLATIYAINNGYSNASDGGGATSCVFCVAPGDQPSFGGSGIQDERSEMTIGENWSNPMTGTPMMPGYPLPNGIDLTGSLSQTVRFYRLDFELPSTWTAPVKVQNTDGSYANPANGGTGNGEWPTPRGATSQVVGGVTFPVGNVVNNDPRGISGSTLSNICENYGPSVLTWGSPLGSGTWNAGGNSWGWRWNCLSLGVFLLPIPRIDTQPIALDQRVCTIVEMVPHLWSTSNGAPYYVPAGTINPYNTTPGTPYSTTHPVNPYGPPPGTPGGGYMRFWRLVNNVWKCVSVGHQLAWPGSLPDVPIGGTIVADPAGDPVNGIHAGKLFGSNVKCNGANLLAGPDGTSGVVLKHDTVVPGGGFDITVNNIVHAVGFHNTGGNLSIDSEMFFYSTWNSSASTVHIMKRGLQGTTPADHSVGAQIAAFENQQTLNPGCNAQPANLIPIAMRHWPTFVSPTFASAAFAPPV
jgi:hypothetical protein